MTILRKALFTGEWRRGREPLPGYTSGSDWNGHACPWFEFEQAEAVRKEALYDTDFDARYDEVHDMFVFDGETLGDRIRYYPADAETEDGPRHVYLFGYHWIWEEVE